MSFKESYTAISDLVKKDFEKLDDLYDKQYFNRSLDSKIKITPLMREFFADRGKRIRSLLSFLLLRAFNFEVTLDDYKIIFAYELIHNASLIHDDIIDCSLLRRGRNTLNFDYDSKLAVLSGDYLLSLVLSILSDFENKKIRQISSDSIFSLLNGELNQYFNRFKLLSFDDYIEKSKNKTAKLFEAVILSCFELRGTFENIDRIRDFSLDFGIAFQINNDLEKFFVSGENEDLENGDYTAPVIFYAQDHNLDDDSKALFKKIKKSDAIEKTQELINRYINSAVANLSIIGDNQYKRAILDLCELFIKKREDSDG